METADRSSVLVDEIRAACGGVAGRARWVSIGEGRVESYAGELPLASGRRKDEAADVGDLAWIKELASASDRLTSTCPSRKPLDGHRRARRRGGARRLNTLGIRHRDNLHPSPEPTATEETSIIHEPVYQDEENGDAGELSNASGLLLGD